MKRSRHALYLIRDYPNALRVRVRAQLRAPAEWAAGTLRPVVLIPGVYETWHFLRTVGDALNERGHPVHVIPALGYNVQPIPQSATLVARELARRDLRARACRWRRRSAWCSPRWCCCSRSCRAACSTPGAMRVARC